VDARPKAGHDGINKSGLKAFFLTERTDTAVIGGKAKCEHAGSFLLLHMYSKGHPKQCSVEERGGHALLHNG